MRKLYPWCMLALFGLFGASPAFAQFTRLIEIPELLDAATYNLTADIEAHDFGSPDYDSVQTFAYNHSGSDSNSYLGPTLVWEVGRTQTMNIQNNLGGLNTTTVHWHGANIPANTDGGPHQTIAPGATFSPSFPVIDSASTLWYHPHAEDATYIQVQMGLAGIIIVRSPHDMLQDTLPTTYAVDDIPIIIQDLIASPNTDTIDTVQGKPRFAILNGLIQPYVDVPPQVIRFRVLDGSTRNSFSLSVVEDTANPANKEQLNLLASDGGYLPDSVRKVSHFFTSTGIRNEFLIDFSGDSNKTYYLLNTPGDLPAQVIGDANNKPPSRNVLMQIRVGNTPTTNPGKIPAALPAIAPLGNPNRTRPIDLGGTAGTATDSLKFRINDRQYVFTTIDDTVNLGDIEDWVVTNTSTISHPFHIHQIQFFVTEVTDQSGTPLSTIPNEYLGPKDNILVQPGQTVTFRASFDTYGTPMPFDVNEDTYMYHCHILTHEDGYYALGGGQPTPTFAQRRHYGMMQQFVVWDGTVNRDLSQPLGPELILFPNPAQDEIKLNGESDQLSHLRIFDLQGKMLQQQLLRPFKGTISIDVSGLESGMVLVEWTSPEGKFVKKVVIE